MTVIPFPLRGSLHGFPPFVQAGGWFTKLGRRTGKFERHAFEDRGNVADAFSSPVLTELNGRPLFLQRASRERGRSRSRR